MAFGLGDSVADQLRAQQLGGDGRSIVMPSQPEPTCGEDQEESDPKRMPAPQRPRSARLSLPRDGEQPFSGQNQPEWAFGQRGHRRCQPKPGPSLPLSPGAISEQCGSSHSERKDPV